MQGQTAAAAAAATTGVTAAPEPEIEEAEMEVDDDEGPIKVGAAQHTGQLTTCLVRCGGVRLRVW
jgi:hypothetical protein